MYVYVLRHALVCKWRSTQLSCIWCSFSTIWVPGPELMLSGLTVNTLTDGPCKQSPQLLFYNGSFILLVDCFVTTYFLKSCACLECAEVRR